MKEMKRGYEKLYNLVESINLIGKSLFEKHINNSDHIYKDILPNLFFEKYVTFLDQNKDIYTPHEQDDTAFPSFLTEDQLSNTHIPQQHLDYFLKERKRFIDQSPKYPSIIDHHYNLDNDWHFRFSAEINLKYYKEIKSSLSLENDYYLAWHKKEEIYKKFLPFIINGINPDYYYEFLSLTERRELLKMDECKDYHRRINDSIKIIKELNINDKDKIKSEDWTNFLDLLFANPVIFDLDQGNLKNFLKFAEEHLDYQSNIQEIQDCSYCEVDYNQLTEEMQSLLSPYEASLMALGTNPEFYDEYKNILKTDTSRRSSKQLLLLMKYKNFINAGDWDELIKKILETSNYNGNFFEFLENLYNEGFCFPEKLWTHLKSKKKYPYLRHNSNLSINLRRFSESKYWSYEEIYNLITGKSIDGEKNIIHSTNLNNHYCIWPLTLKGYDSIKPKDTLFRITLKDRKKINIEDLEIKKVDNKGYLPNEVLDFIESETDIWIHEELKKMVFGLIHKKLKGKDRLEAIERNDRYTSEKRRGGKNSAKRYDVLKSKAEELCKKIMKRSKINSGLELTKKVAQELEKNHKDLLLEFHPYKTNYKEKTDWTRPTFYNWCNNIFKSFQEQA